MLPLLTNSLRLLRSHLVYHLIIKIPLLKNITYSQTYQKSLNSGLKKIITNYFAIYLLEINASITHI